MEGPPLTQGRNFRIGPIEFANGISGVNAWTFLYLNFMIMPIVAFLSISQPYVLSEIVGIPESEQGRITGFQNTMQEVVELEKLSAEKMTMRRNEVAEQLQQVHAAAQVRNAYQAQRRPQPLGNLTGLPVAADSNGSAVG